MAGEDRAANETTDGASASIDQVQALLERLSLTASESRTLVALMQLGSATPNQLAPMTGIGRTNVYRVLESLQQKELVLKLPGRNAVWVACDGDEIIWKLRQREQERFQATEATLEAARDALQSVPLAEQKAVAVLRATDEVTAAFFYEDAVAAAVDEILVFNRGPYVGDLDVNEVVTEALARGVAARALYQAHELTGPAGEPLLRCARAYAEAGVDTKVATVLPLALAIVDRHLSIFSLPGDEPADLPYVANAVVENRAFAGTMAQVFEQIWHTAALLDEITVEPPSGILARLEPGAVAPA